MERYYHSKVRDMSFKPGDMVYRNNDASHAKDGGKLGPKWEGPYEVTEALGKGAYKLRDCKGNDLPRTWNICNLKKCYVHEVTGYDTDTQVQIAVDKWGGNVSSASLAVISQLKNLSDTRRVRADSRVLMVYCNGKWTHVAGTDLMPGDIVSIGRFACQDTKKEESIPADMLILEGCLIVSESTLTDESVPQLKVSVKDKRPEEHLSYKRDKKTHAQVQIAADKWGRNVIEYPQTPLLEQSTAWTPSFCLRPSLMDYVLKTSFDTRCVRADSRVALMMYRNGEWTHVSSGQDIRHGDIVYIGRFACQIQKKKNSILQTCLFLKVVLL
ncbi:reverse transcriptase domain-containing protein [Tanacetum coccineum]